MRNKKHSVNLLYDNLIPLDHWDKLYFWISNVAKYLLIIAEIALVLVFAVHIVYDHKLDDITDKINTQLEYLKTRKKEEADVTILASSLGELTLLESSQYSLAQLHAEIYKLIPPDIRIKSLALSHKAVVISGDANTYDAIKTLFNNVNDSKKINNESIKTSTVQGGTGAIGFNLSFEFK